MFATDGIQLALAQGTFLDGDGIKLSDDRRIATFPINDILESLENKRGDEPTVLLVDGVRRLTWSEQDRVTLTWNP